MEMANESQKPVVKLLDGTGSLCTLELDTKRPTQPTSSSIYQRIQFLMLTTEDLLEIGNQIKVLAIERLKARKARGIE